MIDEIRAALGEVSGRDMSSLEAGQKIVDLGLDSITVADLMLVLEDRYGITLERDEMEALVTLEDLMGLIERKRPSGE